MSVFVDTSALLAMLDADDRRHERAEAVFRDLVRNDDLVTHNYVVVEALALARRRLGRTAADSLADDILPLLTVIWVDESLHRQALATQRAGGAGVSLVDHVSFAVMREHGIEICFAFDPDFDAQGFRQPPSPPERDAGHRVGESPAPYATGPSAPELVSVAEIAARAGRPTNTIQSWRRRHRDFPPPLVQLGTGPIWTWPTVAGWIESHGRSRNEPASRV